MVEWTSGLAVRERRQRSDLWVEKAMNFESCADDNEDGDDESGDDLTDAPIRYASNGVEKVDKLVADVVESLELSVVGMLDDARCEIVFEARSDGRFANPWNCIDIQFTGGVAGPRKQSKTNL